MVIKLVNSSISPAVTTVLVDGQERFVGEGKWGKAVGPGNMRMSLSPGVIMREYIGADRIQGEHIKCDKGTVAFDVKRIFETPADALKYIRTDFLKEQSEGALMFDDDIVFAKAAVTTRISAIVGCAVVANYTIEG